MAVDETGSTSSDVSEAPEVDDEVTLRDLMRRLNTMEKRQVHQNKKLEKKLRMETRVLISEAVDPLKETLSDVNTAVTELQRGAVIQDDRIGKLESQMAKLGVGGGKFNPHDVAHLRVSFSGFKDNVLDDRVATIKAFMDKHFKDRESFACIESRMSGPWNDQKPSGEAYVQLHSRQARTRILKAIEDGKYAEGLTSSKGDKLKVGRYKTDWQRSRDWAIWKAEDLVKEKLAERKMEKAKVEYKATRDERKILVNGEVAFVQKRSDAQGNFVGKSFADLKLP